MQSSAKSIVHLLILGMMIVGGGVVALGWVQVNPEKIVEIPNGASAQEIGRVLRQQGIIRSAQAFNVGISLCRCAQSLHPGRYPFSGRVSLASVLSRLESGEGAQQGIMVTIPEGLRSDQIAKLLATKGVFNSPEEFLEIVRRPPSWLVQQFSWLAWRPSDQGLEGVLFGDTYEFLPNTPPTDVIKRLLTTFERRIVKPLFGHQSSTASEKFYPTLILASIVEQEVRTSEDRALVADVFQKRLKIQMPLQADSTVNFITGRSDPRARLDDTQISSPYNTYRNRELPPGPISNPSVDSVSAVLKPRPNPYYYFLTDPQGGVHYGRTPEEHQKNRQQFLR